MKENKKFRATETISSCTLDFRNETKTMNKNTNTQSKLGKEYADNSAFVGYVKPTQMGKTPRSWFGVRPNNSGKLTSEHFRNGAFRKEGYTATLKNAGKQTAVIVYTPITTDGDVTQRIENAKKTANLMMKEMELGNI